MNINSLSKKSIQQYLNKQTWRIKMNVITMNEVVSGLNDKSKRGGAADNRFKAVVIVQKSVFGLTGEQAVDKAAEVTGKVLSDKIRKPQTASGIICAAKKNMSEDLKKEVEAYLAELNQDKKAENENADDAEIDQTIEDALDTPEETDEVEKVS